MLNRLLSFSLLLLYQAVVVLNYPIAIAEQRELAPARSAIDVVLLVDASGSMLKTDPLKLRYEGAKLFLNFLSKDDRVAIVSFAERAKVVSELKEFYLTSVDNLAKDIQSIKTEGAYSDILEGIKVADKVLETSPRSNVERIVILLSDGKMEPNPRNGLPASRTVELVNQLLPELKTREIKVHSLAFSEQADKLLLTEISAATDGLNWYTANSDQLHKSFASLFLAVKRPQIVPMRSKSFALDDDVDEATFYITRDEGAKLVLVSPKNQELTVEKHPDWVTWFAGKNFDVITMREPDIGEWQVQGGVTTEGFATVLTNLKLVSDWPVIIRVGDRNVVQARLYDGDKPVSLPEMSGVVQYAFQIMPTDRIAPAVARDLLNDAGRDGDRVAGDGIFSRYCTLSSEGEYNLSIVAQGPTFERTQQVPFRVRPRLINLSIGSEEDAEGEMHHSVSEHHQSHAGHGTEDQPLSGVSTTQDQAIKGDQTSSFKVELSKEALGLRELKVSLEVLSSQKRKSVIPIKIQSGEAVVSTPAIDILDQDGVYTVKAILTGTSKKGQEMEAYSPAIKFDLRLTAKRPEPTPTVAIKEPQGDVKKGEGLPITTLSLATGAGLIVLLIGLVLTKVDAKTRSTVIHRYSPPSEMLDAISSLEERLASAESKVGDIKLEADIPVEDDVPQVASEVANAQDASAQGGGNESSPPASEEA